MATDAVGKVGVTAFKVEAPITVIVTGLLAGEVTVCGGIEESVTVGKKLNTPA